MFYRSGIHWYNITQILAFFQRIPVSFCEFCEPIHNSYSVKQITYKSEECVYTKPWKYKHYFYDKTEVVATLLKKRSVTGVSLFNKMSSGKTV